MTIFMEFMSIASDMQQGNQFHHLYYIYAAWHEFVQNTSIPIQNMGFLWLKIDVVEVGIVTCHTPENAI